MGEEVHVELIRHGHADDLPTHQGGLGLLGPGELVHCQIDLHPQVPDGLDDALVAEGEGVEGAGEEGRAGGSAEGECPALDLIGDDEAVDVGEGRGGVEKAQLLLRLLAQQEEDLLGHQGEEGGLVRPGEDLGAENPFSQDLQGLLPDALAVGGQALQQQACQPLPAPLQDLLRLPEPPGIDAVMLQHGAHGGQGCGHDHRIGGGEEQLHLVHDLVQLPGRQPQGELAQIRRDVLGDLCLPRLQDLGQLHRHLVPAVRRQHRGDGQQGGARHPADHDVLTDLHQVGEVGGDVEHVGIVPLLHLVQQIFHAHGLQHPGGGGFQVVQEHAAHSVLPIQHGPLGGDVQPQHGPQMGLQEQQRRAALALGGGHGGGDVRCVRPVGIQRRQQVAEQPQGGGLLGQAAPLQPPDGEGCQKMQVLAGHPLQRQAQHRVQQGEGGVRLHQLRPAVMAEQLPGKAGGVGVGAVHQQGIRRGLGLIADHADLPGGQPAVRVDEPGQVLRPQLEGQVLLRVRRGVRRRLLLIAQTEGRQDAADEGGGPAADIAVRHHQQLIEELQGLLLLGGVPVGEILFEDGHIRLQPGRVLLAPGGLQRIAEQLLVAQPVHQADVVVHGGAPQSGDHLAGLQQGGVFCRRRRASRGAERGIHAEGDEVVLKVPQFGVDVPVPHPLGVVHIIQLAEDDVKGLLQGVEAGDLPVLVIIDLLHPEIRVHQGQRLGGQVLDLQVPDGVVGGDVAQGRQPPAGEPLIRVVVVEVGHTFSGLAAKLAQVVAQGGTGDQPQVDEPAGGAEGSGHLHGHMVDTGDMVQGLEGRHLPAQPQQLVDVFLPEPPEKAAVLLRHAAVGELLLRAQLKVQPEIKGQTDPLQIKEHLEELEKAQGPIPLGGGVSGVRRRVQQRPGGLIGAGQPALRRLRRYPVQQGAEGVQSGGAGDTALRGRQIPAQSAPVHRGEEPLRIRMGHGQLFEEGGRGKGRRPALQRDIHRSYHRSLLLSGQVLVATSISQMCAGGKEYLHPAAKKRPCPQDRASGCSLGKMGVVEDVILAEAVIARALGAVPELQVREVGVRAAADLALVAVALLLGFLFLLLYSGFEMDGLGRVLMPDGKAEFPQQVCDPVPEEHQIYQQHGQQLGQGEQSRPQTVAEQIVARQNYIEHRQPLGLDRKDQIDADQRVGVQGGKGQKQDLVEVPAGDHRKRRPQGADHAEDHHQHGGCQIEQGEFGGAPVLLNGSADEVVEGQADEDPEQGAVGGQEHPGDQPPQLSPQDEIRVKVQHIAGVAVGEQVQHEHHGHDPHQELHQIRNAEAGMAVCEPVHRGVQFSQVQNLPGRC